MKKYLNNRGFTLIEIIIVLVIISILVLLIVPNASNIINSANGTGCKAIEASESALEITNDLTGDNYSIDQADKARVCENQ